MANRRNLSAKCLRSIHIWWKSDLRALRVLRMISEITSSSAAIRTTLPSGQNSPERASKTATAAKAKFVTKLLLKRSAK